ncbi:hypothetical protein L7F22_014419 [Adiantum nelumboides]|nr:hypothetical protein [Adiantum nelumboides]
MLTENGFVHRPRYMDISLPHGTRVGIGQLGVSSHQQEAKSGSATGIPHETRLCRLCRQEVECESHFLCRCPRYTEIRSRYPILFDRPKVSLQSVMTSLDQRLLGRLFQRCVSTESEPSRLRVADLSIDRHNLESSSELQHSYRHGHRHNRG